MAIVAGVFYWVAHFVQGRGPLDIATVLIMCGLVTLAINTALYWKLQVEESGIYRRRCFIWDFWSWDDLASGRISKKDRYKLLDPMRPWWRRSLDFSWMAAEDVQEVIVAINARYVLPPPPVLLERLTIKWNLRWKAVLASDGVEATVRGTSKTYRWHEVRHLCITRIDPLRRDFAELQLSIVDQEIEWKLVSTEYGTYPNWHGATADEINEFLLKYVASERVVVCIAGLPLRDREQINKKLREAEKSRRDLIICLAIFVPLIIAGLLWIAFEGGILQSLILGGMAVINAPLFWFVHHRFQIKIRELKEALHSETTGEPQVTVSDQR